MHLRLMSVAADLKTQKLRGQRFHSTIVFKCACRWAELEAEEKAFTPEEKDYFAGAAQYAYESFRNKVRCCALQRPRHMFLQRLAEAVQLYGHVVLLSVYHQRTQCFRHRVVAH